MVKSLKTNGAPYGNRTRLSRLKSWSKSNDFNGHVDSSCNVPGMDDQMISYESTCRPAVDRNAPCTRP